MPEPAPALPGLNAYVTVGPVISELFELELLHLVDCVDHDTARLVAERLSDAAPERQLTLAVSA